MKNISGIRSIRLTIHLGLHYALIHGFYWAASASLYAFLVVFLQARGFTTSEIGYINSARIGASILGQFFYAYIGDKYKHLPLKYLVSGLLFLSILDNFVIQFAKPGALGTAILFIILGLTECSVVSLIDSMALQFVNIGIPIKYSACRSVGSVVYALICFGLGPVLDFLGTETAILLHGIFLILTVLAVLTFRTFYYQPQSAPENKAVQESVVRSGSVFVLFRKNRQYRWLLISNALLCFGYWPISGFLSNIMAASGGNNTILGIALFVCAMAEMPMMAFIFPILSRKIAIEKLLFFSTVCHFLRWTSLIFIHNPWGIVALQTTQMISYGLSLPAAVQYINTNIEEENRIKGQTLYNMFGNIGGTLGNIIFGNILERTNTTVMTAIGCCFIFLSVLSMFRMMTCSSVGQTDQTIE